MYNLLMLAALAVTAPAPTAQKPTVAIVPVEAEKDAKCLTLALLAANVVKDDPEKMKVVLAESWYFLGRMDTLLPHQELKPLLTSMAEQLQHDPHAKELGPVCDSMFIARATDLRNMGNQSEPTKP